MFDRLGEAGGTVQVAAGEYTPVNSAGISFEGKDIQILAQPGAVLDCGDANAGFVANKGEPPTAVCAPSCVLALPHTRCKICGCADAGWICGAWVHWNI